jgi:hypothetical protein
MCTVGVQFKRGMAVGVGDVIVEDSTNSCLSVYRARDREGKDFEAERA